VPSLAVIIVSARNALHDRLAGLKAGADRYLVKPVDFRELVANIEAATRRKAAGASRASTSSEGWKLISLDWRLVSPTGIAVQLTDREYRFLHLLIEANGQAVARRDIVDALFGPHLINCSERVDVMVARLRRKAAAEHLPTLPVRTVRQVGYTFTAPGSIVCLRTHGPSARRS
jgi:DNA-binding response OmpR family regulator